MNECDCCGKADENVLRLKTLEAVAHLSCLTDDERKEEEEV